MKKYFICSDLHGIDPEILRNSLKRNGFDFNKKDHVLVVLGDITDGLGHEAALIHFLMGLDKYNKLIAVKGNHDVWDGSFIPMNQVSNLDKEQTKWLDNLPVQLEMEEFNLVHGMYLPKDFAKELRDANEARLWASPCLLSKGNWYVLHKEDIVKIKDWANGIQGYVEKLDKLTIMGHFTKPDVADCLMDTGILKETKEGFYHIDNKLFFVDQGILKDPGKVEFLVIEK